MKKVLNLSLFLLVIFAGVTLFSCNAQAPKANLKTSVDTLSYSLGIQIVEAQGLGQYVNQQVDSAYVADFIKGLQSSINVNPKDKKANAYSFGQQIGGQIGGQMFTQMNQSFFGTDSTQTISKKNLLAGIVNALLDKNLALDKDSVQNYISEAQKAIFEKQNATAKAENAAFLEENKSKEGVITLPSGLQYKVITEGTGLKPEATSQVEVDYVGTLIDGTEFDSSVKRGEHSEFALNQVITGWTEGIQLMSVGSKYVFYIPYYLAYGEQGRQGQIPPFATLIFEVDLYNIK